MVASLRRADERQLRVLDSLVLLFVVVWVLLGVGVGYEVWQLSGVGETLSRAGSALDASGRAVQQLRGLPLVGGTPGAIGDQIRATAADVASRGQASQTSIRELAVLLGVTTALLPAGPALFYLPFRLDVSADRRRVRDLVGRLDDDELEAHLARRALTNVPYARLLQITATPERDFAQGRRRELADAELRRLGLRRLASY